MKDTLSGIVSMLETGSPEQRVAAAQVLAWLQPKVPAVVKSLGRIAQEGDSFLRPYAVDALGKIGNAASLAALIPFLHIEGPIRNKVIRIYAKAGKSAVSVLIKEYGKADPVTQMTILEILAKVRSDEALGLIYGILKDPERPGDGERLFQVLSGEIAALDPKKEEDQQGIEILRKHLMDWQKGLPRKTTAQSRAWILDLLAKIADPGCRTLLIGQSAPSHPPEVRGVALRGLVGMDLTPAQTTKLLGYLKEEDFLHVVGPTLDVLSELEPKGAQMANTFAKLLEADRPEVRFFAMKMLGRFHTASAARNLMPFLHSDDHQVHELASRGLGGNPEAAEGVLKIFLAARDLEEVHRPFDAMLLLAPHLKPAQLKKVLDRYEQLVEAEDPVREHYRQVLSAAAPESVGPTLLKEAQKRRSAGNFESALDMLAILATCMGGEVDGDARYELAVTKMLMRARIPELTEGDPVIGHLCHLLNSGYSLLDRLKKEKMLGSDQLYYLGQRFVERLNAERRFGEELLQWIIKQEPEGKASVQALQKLKVEGLA